jgi:microcystin-dependent protein
LYCLTRYFSIKKLIKKNIMATEPFIGEIIIGAFNFAPRNYALCNGQLLPISQNTALFSILGTNYGGNGQTTFGLPNLQGRMAIGAGQGPGLSSYQLGQAGGVPNVTLLTTQMPAHTHLIQGNGGDGTQASPVNNFFAGPGADRDLYTYNAGNTGGTVNMNPSAVNISGGSQPHNNMMPYLALNYCIATAGIFPSRN